MFLFMQLTNISWRKSFVRFMPLLLLHFRRMCPILSFCAGVGVSSAAMSMMSLRSNVSRKVWAAHWQNLLFLSVSLSSIQPLYIWICACIFMSGVRQVLDIFFRTERTCGFCSG